MALVNQPTSSAPTKDLAIATALMRLTPNRRTNLITSLNQWMKGHLRRWLADGMPYQHKFTTFDIAIGPRGGLNWWLEDGDISISMSIEWESLSLLRVVLTCEGKELLSETFAMSRAKYALGASGNYYRYEPMITRLAEILTDGSARD